MFFFFVFFGCFSFFTKGSVSYLSLIAKAYCREGQGSVTDFGAFSRGYDLGKGPPPVFLNYGNDQ